MAEDLVAPIVPTGLLGVEAAVKGFSLVAGINQRNRELQLEIQQMAQQERLKQKQFEIDQASLAQNERLNKQKLDYDYAKLEQEKPLDEAQAKSYAATAELHTAQAKAWADGMGSAAQRKAADIKNAQAFAAELSKMESETPIGTKAWSHQAPLIYSKYPWSQEIQKIYASHVADNYRATTQNRLSQAAVINNFEKVLKETGADPSAFQDPYKWADVPGQKGMKYALFNDKGAQVDPQDYAFTKPKVFLKDFPGYKTLKMPAAQWDMAIKAHAKIQDWNLRQLMAPGDDEMPRLMADPNSQPASGVTKKFTLDENGELVPAQ